MARKSLKVAGAYFITLILALVLVGGAGYYLYNYVLFGEKNAGDNMSYIDETNDLDGYIPNTADKQTLLMIMDIEKRASGCTFMLVRLLPAERKAVIMTLPSETYANVGGTENSIYEFYRTEGSKKAVSAVEKATGLTVDKYIKFNKESFQNLIDVFGGVNYDIPYNLIYENESGEDTIIREGNVYIESGMAAKIFSFPNYKTGEEYRAKMCTLIATEMLNKSILSGFEKHIDEYFSSVINSSIETNITSYDYNEHSEALKYVAASSEKKATNVIVSGEYDDYGRYILDPNFVKSLNEWFKMYEIEDLT